MLKRKLLCSASTLSAMHENCQTIFQNEAKVVITVRIIRSSLSNAKLDSRISRS